jgi:Mce-associated membrane protein
MAKHAYAARQLNGSPPVEDSSATKGDSSPVEEDSSPAAEELGQTDEHDADEHIDDIAETRGQKRFSRVRPAIAVCAAVVVALGCLAGWLGYRTYETRQAQAQRNLLVAVARQVALNLTTIDYTEVDADVQRILDSATGNFREDFKKRSQPFIDVVKKVQSKSEGTVTEAGLESQDGDQARVLVAVSVKTSTAGAPDQEPRSWRMRIGVQRIGDGAKVSDVQFVP